MFYGWKFQLQHLMVFQVEGIDIVYKSQIFHLLSFSEKNSHFLTILT